MTRTGGCGATYECCSVPVDLNLLIVLNKYYSSYCSHNLTFVECSKCKGKKNIEKELQKYMDSLTMDHWLLDSGASSHFTFVKDDLVDVEELENPIPLNTANLLTQITARGMVLIQKHNKVYKLDPVYYVPDLNQHLISLGQLLNDGYKSHSTNKHIVLEDTKGTKFLLFTKLFSQDTLYWLRHSKQQLHTVCNNGFVYSLNYNLLH